MVATATVDESTVSDVRLPVVAATVVVDAAVAVVVVGTTATVAVVEVVD